MSSLTLVSITIYKEAGSKRPTKKFEKTFYSCKMVDTITRLEQVKTINIRVMYVTSHNHIVLSIQYTHDESY